MRRGVALGLVAMAACFSKPERVGGDAGDERCFGTGRFTVCLPELPSSPVTLASGSSTQLNTDDGACTTGTLTGVIVEPGGGAPKLCVVAGTTVTIAGTLAARGGLPLVLLASESALELTSEGFVDVSSQVGLRGAGAGFACELGTAPQPRGGGHGGSFGSPGGNGGAGGGVAPATAEASFVRGGCAGGASTAPGAAGESGGAVYLLAAASLVIAGRVDASGAPGSGGRAVDGGGGGGGSGGLIAVFAGDAIVATGAQLWANGGGGGGGGASGGNDGQPGGVSPDPSTRAIGGAAGGNGATAGGVGAIGTESGGTALDGSRGGGGGGGGVGVIENVSGQPITGATVSPPPT